MISPLISLTATKPQQPTVGGLVTVVDYAGRHLAARLNRYDARSGNVWVSLVGWPEQPYQVGMALTLDISQVIDWD